MAIPGQAFCANEACAVLAWNPNRTLAELVADIRRVDASGMDV
jgi:hypothetical protein